jgi:type IV pilus assembly protein PilF
MFVKTKVILASFLISVLFGCSSMQTSDDPAAKQKLLLALDEGPNLPEAWYSMGYFMEVTGDPVNARKYYLKSVDIAPKQGDVHNNFGTFLCRHGEYKEAIKHFMLAINDQEYLDSAAAYENAGLCALKIPDKKLALSYFNHAIRADPNHPSALIEAATLNYEDKNYRDAKLQLAEYMAIAAPTAQSQALRQVLQSVDIPAQRILS